MCLAIPGKIIKLKKTRAVVSFKGIKQNVDVRFVKTPKLGDYVLVHVGFAIQKVDKGIACETYRLLDKMDKEDLENEQIRKKN
jgi:hydrogenase expression/formation protein HypC